MEQYSRQFITEVERHIDSKLTRFFKLNCEVKHFPYSNIKDSIDDTLMFFFEGKFSREDLLPIINKVKKSRLQKRSRWHKAYINDLTILNKDDKSFPIDLSKIDEYEVEQRIETEIKNTDKWKKNKNSYFIEFPGLHQFTDSSIYNSFRTDLIICIWKYIDNELNGNIGSFYRSYPESLIETPLFSPSSFNMMMSETGNNLLEEVIYDDNENSVLKVTIPNNKFVPPKVMDGTDLKILNTFISYINNDFYKDKTVIVDLGYLAKSVVDYNPGGNIYKSVAERCSKLVEYNYTVQDNRGKLSFNLFDNIVVRDENEENPYVIATFGEILANAIIQKKLINVTDNSFSLLKHPLSQIIYYALQSERVSLNSKGLDSCRYTYTYFQKIVRFKKRNKKVNLELIGESLQDFVDNGVCIKSFTFSNDGFIINFLPLTEEELEDINFENKLLEKK